MTTAEELIENRRSRLRDRPGDGVMGALTIADYLAAIREAIQLAQRLDGMGEARFAARWSYTLAALAEVEAQIADLKVSVVAFGAPSMVERARDMGLPDKHLFPEHYDLLARCGARMDDFTRGEEHER